MMREMRWTAGEVEDACTKRESQEQADQAEVAGFTLLVFDGG
jgi:hypothetical protein